MLQCAAPGRMHTSWHAQPLVQRWQPVAGCPAGPRSRRWAGRRNSTRQHGAVWLRARVCTTQRCVDDWVADSMQWGAVSASTQPCMSERSSNDLSRSLIWSRSHASVRARAHQHPLTQHSCSGPHMGFMHAHPLTLQGRGCTALAACCQCRRPQQRRPPRRVASAQPAVRSCRRPSPSSQWCACLACHSSMSSCSTTTSCAACSRRRRCSAA
jgi:hypothetical protein